MDRELLPGLLVDGSGAHASVRPGLTAMVLSPPKGTDLSGIRTLTLPESMESFAGIEKFRNLRLIRYDGTAEVFSFEEPLLWLSRNSDDLDAFAGRLATNLIAFRPVTPALCAIVAPNMPPIQAGEGWKRLMNALEYRVKTSEEAGGLRQDGSREHVIIFRSYTIFRHLQWCFSLGRAISPEPFSAEADAVYAREPSLSPEEQLYLLISAVQGHDYEEFVGITGDRRVVLMRDVQLYADERRREIRWRDDETFQKQLLTLLEDGLVTPVNYPALLDLLTRHRMPGSTALAIRFGSAHPELRAQPPEDDFFL